MGRALLTHVALFLGVSSALRSTSFLYGADRVEAFCARNHLDLVIRAHQYIMDGCVQVRVRVGLGLG